LEDSGEREGRMNEEWRPVPGWEETYEVSDLGRVRSLDRLIRCVDKVGVERARECKGRVLSPGVGRKGYRAVKLQGAGMCKPKRMRVHRLVAMAFIPNEGNRPHINHIDHDRQNNAFTNLEWCTPSENMQHAGKAGRLGKGGLKGSGHPLAKLTEASVVEIRRRLELGHRHCDIAKDYCVGRRSIGLIKEGRTWKHIT
jgi:hypothetical protein